MGMSLAPWMATTFPEEGCSGGPALLTPGPLDHPNPQQLLPPLNPLTSHELTHSGDAAQAPHMRGLSGCTGNQPDMPHSPASPAQELPHRQDSNGEICFGPRMGRWLLRPEGSGRLLGEVPHRAMFLRGGPISMQSPSSKCFLF